MKTLALGLFCFSFLTTLSFASSVEERLEVVEQKVALLEQKLNPVVADGAFGSYTQIYSMSDTCEKIRPTQHLSSEGSFNVVKTIDCGAYGQFLVVRLSGYNAFYTLSRKDVVLFK